MQIEAIGAARVNAHIGNLFAESEKHRIRLEKIIASMGRLGFENPGSVFHLFPQLQGVPVTFDTGETWELIKITVKHWQRIGNCKREFDELIYHFRSKDGKRAIYRSYWGGSKNKPQSSKRIIDLYQDELNREWWQRKTPPIMLDVAERLLNIEQRNKNHDKRTFPD